MARKKSSRKIKQIADKAARKRIEEFHIREEERRKVQQGSIRNFNYEIVELPQPLASMTVLGLTRILKSHNLGNYKYREKVLVFAEMSTDESNGRIRDDDALYTICVNARHMGYLGKTAELPVGSYIGYVVVGEKTKEGNYTILDSFYFNELKRNKPEILSTYKPLKAVIEYVKLEGNVIKVPLSDDLWSRLENQEKTYLARHNPVFFYWKPFFDVFYSDQYGFGNENGLYDIVFSNKGRERRYTQNDNDAITKELCKGAGMKKLEAMVFHFDKMTLKYDDEESAFEILKIKEWILDWNCVLFRNGYFIIFPPEDGSVIFNPRSVSYPGVIESFNYLKSYFNVRLAPVSCFVQEMTLTISNLFFLDEAIMKYASASNQRAITMAVSKNVPRTKLTQMPYNQVLSKAQQLPVEEFKKYKSKYIDFLTKHQHKKYKIIPCVERLAHTTGDFTEYAFIFSIKCKQDRVLIVHENVNPDRSSILFVVEENAYDKTIRAIYDFLQGAEINKRSGIRDGAIQIEGTGVVNYKSVNHNDLNSWQRIIEDYINNAMNLKKMERNLYKATFSSLNRLLKVTQKVENFTEAKPIFEMLNLPLNRKVTPAHILSRVPESNFYIDKDGNKYLANRHRRKKYSINSKGEKVEIRDINGKPVYEYKLYPIQKNSWSLEKLVKLLTETYGDMV